MVSPLLTFKINLASDGSIRLPSRIINHTLLYFYSGLYDDCCLSCFCRSDVCRR